MWSDPGAARLSPALPSSLRRVHLAHIARRRRGDGDRFGPARLGRSSAQQPKQRCRGTFGFAGSSQTTAYRPSRIRFRRRLATRSAALASFRSDSSSVSASILIVLMRTKGFGLDRGTDDRRVAEAYIGTQSGTRGSGRRNCWWNVSYGLTLNPEGAMLRCRGTRIVPPLLIALYYGTYRTPPTISDTCRRYRQLCPIDAY